jgi:hypothetical protein
MMVHICFLKNKKNKNSKIPSDFHHTSRNYHDSRFVRQKKKHKKQQCLNQNRGDRGVQDTWKHLENCQYLVKFVMSNCHTEVPSSSSRLKKFELQTTEKTKMTPAVQTTRQIFPAVLYCLIIFTAILVTPSNSECANGCNGHGRCTAYDMCICWRNWQAVDCSERVCMFGQAHVDVPKVIKSDFNLNLSIGTLFS